MDTPAQPDQDLRPLLEQLRAAHRRRTPDYAQRMADLKRLGEAIRRHRDEVVKAVSAGGSVDLMFNFISRMAEATPTS